MVQAGVPLPVVQAPTRLAHRPSCRRTRWMLM